MTLDEQMARIERAVRGMSSGWERSIYTYKTENKCIVIIDEKRPSRVAMHFALWGNEGHLRRHLTIAGEKRAALQALVGKSGTVTLNIERDAYESETRIGEQVAWAGSARVSLDIDFTREGGNP